jgi:predicted RNA binding protein YcfA (HicA-like mRNA interferase family)
LFCFSVVSLVFTEVLEKIRREVTRKVCETADDTDVTNGKTRLNQKEGDEGESATELAAVSPILLSLQAMKFSELVRLLEQGGFRLIKEKGSIRYYAKAGHPRLIRVDFHGAKEVPTGTCHAILKAAGLKRK